MVTGATFETALREKCPDIGDVVYYSSTSDLIAALQAYKIAFVDVSMGTPIETSGSFLQMTGTAPRLGFVVHNPSNSHYLMHGLAL